MQVQKVNKNLTNEGGGLIILLQGFLYLYYTQKWKKVFLFLV